MGKNEKEDEEAVKAGPPFYGGGSAVWLREGLQPSPPSPLLVGRPPPAGKGKMAKGPP